MAFKKGISANPGGRKAGIPNKTTTVQREFLQTLLDGQQDKIKTELTNLEGKEYLAVIVSLLKYVVPAKIELVAKPKIELLKFGYDDDRADN